MKTRNLLITLSFFVLSACTPEMQKISSGILSSTGYVSSSQVDSFFQVGAKLSKATQAVSDEQEYYLGRSVAAQVCGKYSVASNGGMTTYANKIAQVLASNSSRPETFGGYRVAFLDTPQVNAVSAPGGFILISSGFLSLVESEDELAAIIAHEIGHVALKHGLSAISESNLTDALQIIGKEAAASSGNMAVSELNSLFGDSVNEVVGTLLDKGYSRSAEYEADEYASKLLLRTGYNPNALGTILDKLEKASKTEGGWFETHPSPDDRKDEIDDLDLKVGQVSGEEKRLKRFKATAGK